MQLDELYQEIRDLRKELKEDAKSIARIEEKLDKYNNIKQKVYETAELCKDNTELIEKMQKSKDFRSKTLTAVLITAPISAFISVVVSSLINKLVK